jgi:hypothetical protein
VSDNGKLVLIVCGILLGVIILAGIVVSILNALQHHLFIYGLLVGIVAGVGLTFLGLRIKDWFRASTSNS